MANIWIWFPSHPMVLLTIMVGLSLKGRSDGSCNFHFSRSTSQNGTFSSPNYPNPYPYHVYCRYIFQGTPDDRILISWDTFDLEEGKKEGGGCLYDYVDVFTIDMDGTKDLKSRLCGSVKPDDFLSIKQRVELEFRSDYKGSNTGFVGLYKFIDEEWQPFPSDVGCGEKFIKGVGGVISSPRFPDPYPDNSVCTWMIKVEREKNILLNLIELDMGQSVHCVHTYIAIYNGFASDSIPPDKRMCGQPFFYEPSLMEFKSKTNRVVIRFHGKRDKRHGGRGFRMAWTAVKIPKVTQDEEGNYHEEPCHQFHCEGGEYCIDTESLLCNALPRYCIDETLVCNDVINCGQSDHSDEAGCLKKIIIILGYVLIPVTIIIVVAILVVCLWKRRKAAKAMSQKQDNNSDNFLKLERSPSVKRKSSMTSPKMIYVATYGVLCKSNYPSDSDREDTIPPSPQHTWRQTPSPRLGAVNAPTYNYSSVLHSDSESRSATV